MDNGLWYFIIAHTKGSYFIIFNYFLSGSTIAVQNISIKKTNHMRHILFISIITLVTYNSISQEVNNSYPDQIYPDSIPIIFGKGTISTPYAEFGITFTPDLSEIYFTRRGDYSS